MLILTDNLLNRAGIDELIGLRDEILNSYGKKKALVWEYSKNGGKYKLPSRKMMLGEYPFAEKIIDSLVSQKILRQYFVTLKNSYVIHSAEKSSAVSCSDFSIELGMELIVKYFPQICDDTKIFGLKGSPVNFTPHVLTKLKDAALDIESRLGVAPVIPSLHFSILKHQSFIPIHADDKSKLLSVMLYLPTPDQNNNVNLGTSFWYPKKPHNQIYDIEEYEGRPDNEIQHVFRKDFVEHKSPFANGSIVSFLKTSTSWHSFSYEGPDLGPRVSLNLNIHTFR